MVTNGETSRRAKSVKDSNRREDNKANPVNTKNASTAKSSQADGPPIRRIQRLSSPSAVRKSIVLNVYPEGFRKDDGKLALIATAFHEFANISTFHGLRYILAYKTHLFRRFLWLCVITTCFGIFTAHFLEQYARFFRNPTIIKVNKIYTDFIEFPAVTICNDNVFRISAALEHGLIAVIKNLFEGDLTLKDIYDAGAANLTLDELDYKAGNRVQNMLLSCKWQGKYGCDTNNFTTVLTDYGLCFTFNGPDFPTNLIAVSPGSSHGLELVLNIEEYERMAGPKVGSGVHIFVQDKWEYPLVEQKGQAIAAGSYTFVTLQLKKEKRLGQPYDDCIDSGTSKVFQNKYKYSMATCKVDCYVKFVVKKCGCKDYFLPGNAPVCTFFRYVTCLRDAKDEYQAIKDKVCECFNPCNTEYLEPFYSYSALSKDVQNVLNPGETDRIMKRFKWALDINEYNNVENQHKKTRYRNFTQSVNRLNEFYDKLFMARIYRVMRNMLKVEKQAELIAVMAEDILKAQICIYKRGFVNTRESYDLEMIKKLAEDHEIFGRSVIRKMKTMRESANKNIQNVLYVLLIGDIHGRMQIINVGLNHIYNLQPAFQNGTPSVKDLSTCVKLKHFKGMDPQVIIPRQTLIDAVERSEEILRRGVYTFVNLKRILDLLQTFSNISTDMFMNKTTPELRTRATMTSLKYSRACTDYLVEREAIQTELIEWPFVSLTESRDKVIGVKKECEKKLSHLINELNVTYRGFLVFKTQFKEYIRIIPVLNQYLLHFNVSKFKIAEHFSDQNSEEVHGWMSDMTGTFSSRLGDYVYHLNKVLECYKGLYLEIFKRNVLFNAFELKDEHPNVSEKSRKSLFNETFNSINELQALEIITPLHTEHLQLAQDIRMDATKFTNQAVIDVKFYSKNFIFLNIFFSEISYTITEQQKDFGIYHLISDIGGTIGLLIGGSIVSLFEILDFAMCLCVSLVKWTPFEV